MMKTAVIQWITKYPNDPQAISAWAQLQLSEVDTLMIRGSESDLSRAAKVLVQTTNRMKLDHHGLVSSWLYQKLPPAANLPNYQRLAELAANSDEASSLLFEVLGTAAAMRNDNQSARELLSRAAEKDPGNAIALNNLAYIISLHFADEMPLALELAEKAFQVDSEDIRILHTRGFIYLRLKQWEAAIKDLRSVIARNPDAADVHRGLAEAYRQTGRGDLAALHETQAR
jgi:tetratricopeptide (TPR) repeat protein